MFISETLLSLTPKIKYGHKFQRNTCNISYNISNVFFFFFFFFSFVYNNIYLKQIRNKWRRRAFIHESYTGYDIMYSGRSLECDPNARDGRINDDRVDNWGRKVRILLLLLSRPCFDLCKTFLIIRKN